MSARSNVITTPTKTHSHKSICLVVCLVVAIFYLQWPVNTLPRKLCKGTRGNAITDPQSHPIHNVEFRDGMGLRQQCQRVDPCCLTNDLSHLQEMEC